MACSMDPGLSWYCGYNAFGEWEGSSPRLPQNKGRDEPMGHQGTNPHMMLDCPRALPGVSEGVQNMQDRGCLVTLLQGEQEQYVPVPTAVDPPRVALGEKNACQECGATFACSANLRNHHRIHTGERPFMCEECGLSFTQRSNLRSHKRVHTGERPYMCGVCGQTFARSSHLPGHMRRHTGEKPFCCPHCGRCFATRQILKNHLRTHSGERPFTCPFCQATFAQGSCLATHKKIHTGERNFKCEQCGKSFISRSGLQTHRRVHSGEKPYQCERCSKAFKTSSYLSKHRQKYCGNHGYKKRGQQAITKKASSTNATKKKASKDKDVRKMRSSPRLVGGERETAAVGALEQTSGVSHLQVKWEQRENPCNINISMESSVQIRVAETDAREEQLVESVIPDGTPETQC